MIMRIAVHYRCECGKEYCIFFDHITGTNEWQTDNTEQCSDCGEATETDIQVDCITEADAIIGDWDLEEYLHFFAAEFRGHIPVYLREALNHYELVAQ